MSNGKNTDHPGKHFTIEYSRRAVAIERILGGITTDEIEKATSYEGLIRTVVIERKELLWLVSQIAAREPVWTISGKLIRSSLSDELLQKVLQQ